MRQGMRCGGLHVPEAVLASPFPFLFVPGLNLFLTGPLPSHPPTLPQLRPCRVCFSVLNLWPACSPILPCRSYEKLVKIMDKYDVDDSGGWWGPGGGVGGCLGRLCACERDDDLNPKP